jgi:hypothetical protein
MPKRYEAIRGFHLFFGWPMWQEAARSSFSVGRDMGAGLRVKVKVEVKVKE